MGRPKIKIIDDSLPEIIASGKNPAESEARQRRLESSKTKKAAKKDDLVAKINAELGIKEESKSNEKPKESENKTSVIPPEGGIQLNKPSSELDSHLRGNDKIKKPQASKAKPRSKKYQEASKDLDKSKSYPITESIELVKKISYSKFNGTLEAHINTVTTGIRGLVSLPFSSGKKLTILAFGKDADKSGADIIGDEAKIEEINKGKIDFDLLLTTSDWMPKLAKVAKNLGPRGLMPNPKSGTITTDLKKSVESFQSGKTEYKTEAKAPVMHLGLGKLSQPTEELSANLKALVQIIGKTRVKKISLSPTMGAGVRVDLTSI